MRIIERLRFELHHRRMLCQWTLRQFWKRCQFWKRTEAWRPPPGRPSLIEWATEDEVRQGSDSTLRVADLREAGQTLDEAVIHLAAKMEEDGLTLEEAARAFASAAHIDLSAKEDEGKIETGPAKEDEGKIETDPAE